MFFFFYTPMQAQSSTNGWKKKILANENVFDNRYLDYSKWTVHFNSVMYVPAYAKKIEGVYDIDTKPMRGYNFGLKYTFNREKQLSYYIGLDLDYIPFYFYYYEVPEKEFPNGTPVIGYDYYKRVNEHNVLTMPFGITWKSQIYERKINEINFIFCSDIRFHFIQPGEMSHETIRGGISYFYIYGVAQEFNILSPTINLSAGLNWLTKYAIVNLSINIQKGIVPYLQGEYKFYNLKVSPDTRGIYKVRADYAGIDIGITPKKWRKR